MQKGQTRGSIHLVYRILLMRVAVSLPNLLIITRVLLRHQLIPAFRVDLMRFVHFRLLKDLSRDQRH